MITCSICYETVDAPKVLPCSHILCVTCIEKSKNWITCGTCSKQYKLGTKFPDFIAQEHVCAKTYYCYDCPGYFCASCPISHADNTLNHKAFLVEDLEKDVKNQHATLQNKIDRENINLSTTRSQISLDRETLSEFNRLFLAVEKAFDELYKRKTDYELEMAICNSDLERKDVLVNELSDILLKTKNSIDIPSLLTLKSTIVQKVKEMESIKIISSAPNYSDVEKELSEALHLSSSPTKAVKELKLSLVPNKDQYEIRWNEDQSFHLFDVKFNKKRIHSGKYVDSVKFDYNGSDESDNKVVVSAYGDNHHLLARSTLDIDISTQPLTPNEIQFTSTTATTITLELAENPRDTRKFDHFLVTYKKDGKSSKPIESTNRQCVIHNLVPDCSYQFYYRVVDKDKVPGKLSKIGESQTGHLPTDIHLMKEYFGKERDEKCFESNCHPARKIFIKKLIKESNQMAFYSEQNGYIQIDFGEHLVYPVEYILKPSVRVAKPSSWCLKGRVMGEKEFKTIDERVCRNKVERYVISDLEKVWFDAIRFEVEQNEDGGTNFGLLCFELIGMYTRKE